MFIAIQNRFINSQEVDVADLGDRSSNTLEITLNLTMVPMDES